MAEEAKKKVTKKEVVAKAFPKGKKIKLNERVEVRMIVDKNGLNEGDVVKVHVATAEQFVAMKVAELV